MVRRPYDDDDGDQSEVSIDEDIEDGGKDDRIAMSFDDLALDEFDNCLNKMSITPKNNGFGGRLQGHKQMPSRIRPSASPESL